jgi:hypothetical protein
MVRAYLTYLTDAATGSDLTEHEMIFLEMKNEYSSNWFIRLFVVRDSAKTSPSYLSFA